MSFDTLMLAVCDGIAYASLVFLVAVGLTFIFGVLGVLNIAHGSFYALGAYVAVSAGIALTKAGFSPWLTFPALFVAALAVGIVLGGLMEKFLLQRIYDKEQVLQILVTFAIFMMLENIQRLVWGVQPYFMSEPLQLLGNVELFGISYTAYQTIFLPILAIVVLIGLRTFLRHTSAGAQILAVTEDREAASAIGINAERVYFLTFIVGASLAALGGAVAAPTTSLIPGMGAEMIVLSFAVAATAGLGQIEGAAVAALMIGLGRSLAVYVAPEFEVLVPYILMVLVLIVRPSGLFGAPQLRKI
ncbi:branched-chain amino acid ABC transporter permease [Aquabacter sp. P-9]|uniref:branched-chain amino acid ABC transporter permease n=1 Tax=Aquabacter sediminis TaxID=3029197 RepID=UPI00237DE629|nr:branched-chain amino acid ABC transporter permease [Aquabacter sp. P-9]MDE1567496.1 branched-chain amino acid ABC transporter permease [Aquabacter sp. P-9]